MFKVMIKRTAPPEKIQALRALITRLRIGASGQTGYISGETLENTEHPGELLVISIWDTEKDWLKWLKSDERIAMQTEIDKLVGPVTETKTYTYPHHMHTV